MNDQHTGSRTVPQQTNDRVNSISMFGRLLSGAVSLMAVVVMSSGQAQAAGCQGASATSDTGAVSADVSANALQDTLDQAKARSGVSALPTYAGIAVSTVLTHHDGYRLSTPVAQTDCAGATIAPINELQPFDSQSSSVGGVIEADMTRSLGLSAGNTLKVGTGVSGKWVNTSYEGFRFDPAAPATGGPAIGVRSANGDVNEDGVLFDFYTLATFGQSYLISSSSFGFGESSIENFGFQGVEFDGVGGTRPGFFGGGKGKTDYFEYMFSGTAGHVFQLPMGGSSPLLLDLSGTLLYQNYDRDGYRDSANVVFSNAETETFAGIVSMTLGIPVSQNGMNYVPFLKGTVKHRFDFDSQVTVSNPTTGLCAVATGCATNDTFNLTSDDTHWRAGAGFSGTSEDSSFTGGFEVFYGGAGDFDEIGGRAQLLFRIN